MQFPKTQSKEGTKIKLDRVVAVRNNKTIYRDGDRCVKVFNAEYSKSDILNETLNQARIEETGLNVPKILEVTMIDDKWAIASEYIKGKTLLQLMESDTSKKNEFIETLVDIQLSVHAKKSPLLSKQKDKMILKIVSAELDDKTRCYLRTYLENMPECDEVCHGDFNPSNIIIAEDGTPYILDWSHVTQGNALADVAGTYLWFLLNGDNDDAKKYIDLFCEKNNAKKQHIQKWIPLVAASRLIKSNKKEREFLLSWVNIEDNE